MQLLVKRQKLNQFNHMASRLADPKCPPSKWWSLARNLCGLKGHSSNFIPPLSGRDHGPVLSDNLEKANAFNDVFINQNTSTALESFPFGPTTTESLFSGQTVTASEVKSVLKSLPSKISSGVDNISYRLLKEAGPGAVNWSSYYFVQYFSAQETSARSRNGNVLWYCRYLKEGTGIDKKY